MRAWEAFVTVARYEVIDAFRSRWALCLLALFLSIFVAASFGFTKYLKTVESELLDLMSLESGSAPGSTTRTLCKSRRFQQMVGRMVGDEELAAEVLAHPPFAIFYGWLAMALGPWLVVLVAAPRIAEDVSRKSVRYVLFRTRRGTWCLGKLAGQAGMLAVAMTVGGCGAWLVALIRLPGFEAWETAASMSVLGAKAWVYCLAYLGLALGISQTTRSPVLAITLGLVSVVGVSIVSGVCSHFAGEGWRQWLEAVHTLTPQAHRSALWLTTPAFFIPAVVSLVAVGLLLFLLGHLRFARRHQ